MFTIYSHYIDFIMNGYRKLSKSDKKFIVDITYGILASWSCLLTDVIDQLHEKTKKVNSLKKLACHKRAIMSLRFAFSPQMDILSVSFQNSTPQRKRIFTSINNIIFKAMNRGCRIFGKVIFVRWRIKEYFRCKKQGVQFENFCVRKLKVINALILYYFMHGFHGTSVHEIGNNALKVAIIQSAAPIKETVIFCYYRLAKGVFGILSYAKEGVRCWPDKASGIPSNAP